MKFSELVQREKKQAGMNQDRQRSAKKRRMEI